MGNIVWRNREVPRHAATILAVGVAAVSACAMLHPVAGGITALFLLIVLALFYKYVHTRSSRIARLSEQLGKITSGQHRLDISEYAEGELSILSSDIAKLTSALAHQAESLGRDKAFLADMLADISHQLKTPLTSISVLVELLEAPGLPEEKRREFLTGIRISLDRTQWLISSLLKLSRLDAGAVHFQLQPASLSDILKKAVEPLLLPMEVRGQTLSFSAAPAILLNTDAHWLTEAAGNLLKNCMEHAGEGGCISLLAQQNPLYTEIQVADDGPGFCPHDLPYLFERFYRGKNASTDSVGIGLALSKSIILNLGGTLTAENRPEGGARFVIKLYGKTVV